jgi:signal transduction histidine kinase
MASRRVPRLRTVLGAVTVWLVLLSSTVVGVLLLLSSYLEHATVELGAAIESVRLAEEVELNLLLYDRADSEARLAFEQQLRQQLLDARTFALPGAESDLLRQAEERVRTYIQVSRAVDGAPSISERRPEVAARLEAARSSLEALVDMNVEQARMASAKASHWNDVAKVLGIGSGVLLFGTAGIVLWWVSTRAFRPVLDLGRVMERFGKGDRHVRALETGPSELREMTLRFNEMADALAAQRKAQLTFMGGVAHDLRTPLSALRMALAALPPERALPPEARLRRTLEVAQRQVTRLERMLGDLIDTAKIESGSLELKFEVEDARVVVADVLSLFEEAASEHRVVLEMPQEEVPIRCDAVRIGQVVTNLLSNAIKYSPRGGAIEVLLERRPEETEDVVISVSDQGIGMSEEDQRHLFEPFRRVGLGKDSVPGVGLGLFVVQQIVRAHGGYIDVESAPGSGSTFRVHLPAATIH